MADDDKQYGIGIIEELDMLYFQRLLDEIRNKQIEAAEFQVMPVWIREQ